VRTQDARNAALDSLEIRYSRIVDVALRHLFLPFPPARGNFDRNCVAGSSGARRGGPKEHQEGAGLLVVEGATGMGLTIPCGGIIIETMINRRDDAAGKINKSERGRCASAG